MLQLQKYNGKASRHECPSCGIKGVFARYADEFDKQIADELGRCDRESKCGYHLKPKEYFEAQGTVWTPSATQPEPKTEPLELVEISRSYFENSLTNIEQNSFVKFLLSRYDSEEVMAVVERYSLGDFEGFTVYWRIDQQERINTGHCIKYDPATGKRIKGQGVYSQDWMHSILKRRGALPENSDYRRNYFGDHLLTNDSEAVAIVEAEKTAVIAALELPEYQWLACGGKSHLSVEKLQRYAQRRVILFPDADGFEKWSEIANQARSQGLNVTVSDLLEMELTEAQKSDGWDLADYLLDDPTIEAEAATVKEFLTTEPQPRSCPTCAKPLASSGKYHFWCEAGHYDLQEVIPANERANYCQYCHDPATNGACDACRNQTSSTIAGASQSFTVTA